MASAHKKVLLRTNAHAVLPGYLPASGIADSPTGSVQLFDLSGRTQPVPLAEVRMISYVRDFNLSERENPEGLLRRTFLARPRTEGLWVRLTFRPAGGVSASPSYEAEVLEGLTSLNLALLDSAMEDGGIYLVPPDIRSNTQRVFVPRTALTGLEILGVITTPTRIQPEAKPRPDRALQDELFGGGS